MNADRAAQAVEKPVIQGKLDHLERLSAELQQVVSDIDAHLNRLTNRPPQPVRDEKAPRVSGEAPRPSVEGSLNLLGSHLEVTLADAQAVLERLQKAI